VCLDSAVSVGRKSQRKVTRVVLLYYSLDQDRQARARDRFEKSSQIPWGHKCLKLPEKDNLGLG
jgi:hypothetical protein